MKLFSLDCHIGINDLKYIFESLGHTFDVWSISGHSHLLGWEKKNPKHINAHTWRNLDEDLAFSFAREYAGHLSKYDAFVCFYPSSFSMIYDFFDKPIIIQAPIRTDVPFERDPEKSSKFYSFMKQRIKQGKIIPVANNRIDQEYNSILTNSEWDLIPSLCDYTNAKYSGTKNDFIYPYQHRFKIPEIERLILSSGFSGMSWQQIYSFKGIVHIPYHNTIMSLFEQYTAGVPLFFPDIDLLKKLRKDNMNSVLNEMSWQQIQRLPSIQRKEFTVKNIPDIGNWQDKQTLDYWIPKSDWYDKEWFPDINLFSSFDNLQDMLIKKDFNVQTNLNNRKERIINLWDQKLKKI